jgi:hypothetical protein
MSTDKETDTTTLTPGVDKQVEAHIEADEEKMWNYGFLIAFISLCWAGWSVSSERYELLIWPACVFLAFLIANSGAEHRGKGSMKCFAYFGVAATIIEFLWVVLFLSTLIWFHTEVKW